MFNHQQSEKKSGPQNKESHHGPFQATNMMPLTGFPGSSAGKELACNAGALGSIPGLGRSPGEGIGCPLQYSWTSLVAQMVKNPPAMQETWFDPWVRKIPWRRACNPLQYSCLEEQESHEQRSLVGYSPWGRKELDTTERLSTVT